MTAVRAYAKSEIADEDLAEIEENSQLGEYGKVIPKTKEQTLSNGYPLAYPYFISGFAPSVSLLSRNL